jgi:hypothetical protein
MLTGGVVGARAIGLATLHPSLHQAAFADEADFTQTRFEPGVLASALTQ